MIFRRGAVRFRPSAAKWCPDDRYAAILARANRRNPKAWAMFYLCGHLGLRVAELVLVAPAHFDWQRGLAMVPTVKKRLRPPPLLPVYFGESVGAKLRRAVDLAEDPAAPDCPLFPVTTRWVQRVWTRYRDAVGGLEGLGIHSLRHWFGVATYKATRDIVFTRNQMRHSDVAATQVYAQVVDGAAQAGKLEGL